MTTVARLLPRAFTFVPRVVTAGPVHWRRRAIAGLLVAAILAAGYVLWFRDSSLVRVENVRVVGLSAAPDAPKLRAQLAGAALGMTTLDVDQARLRGLVSRSPAVHAIEVTPDFPHGLLIRITENRPVALLSAGGHNVPIAADGTLLEGVDAGTALPTVRTVALPTGTRLGSGPALDRVTVAAAAPPALLAKVASITIQPGKGFVAQLTGGPAIWLGGNARLEEKWAAAAAVLAQPSSQGATYVDARLPERPVAGGLQVPTNAQPGPEAPAPGAIPGAPAAIPADPNAGTVPGQAPAATTPSVPPTATTPAPSPNPQP
jgi:cell division protein FtsQ